ncbi:MAG: SDH family Clp fold serine proteinase [Candidatus Aminicenantales bacterium]
MNTAMNSLWSLFWFFLIVVSILPAIQRKVLENRRLALMRRLEVKRQSRVISLIHRQETMKFLGFPLMRYIDINDSEEVLRAIRLTPEDMPIDLIIHTPGGLVLSTEQIALALVRHKGKVTVFVPHYAMSGGTLLCLAADEIVMDQNAVLGPVDPQLGEFPAVSILKVVKEKPISEVDDRTLILADVAEKALRQMRDFVAELIANRTDRESAAELATILTEGRWTHDYPITCEEAGRLGLPVSCNMPDEIYELMELFPQASPQRPSVQYIPVPYKKVAEPGKKSQ